MTHHFRNGRKMTDRPDLGWLIETGSQVPCYIELGKYIAWTHDSNKALRFAREQDAQAFLDAFYVNIPGGVPKGSIKVVEHMWVGRLTALGDL